MKHINFLKHKAFFKPLISTLQVQSAVMVLKPGQSSSDEVENEHPKAEQWLFVISGHGRATVGTRSIAIKTGSLLVIEKAERHQITGTGSKPLITLNLYCPPAYTDQGKVKTSVTR
ncbi:MAG: cupin domain-containing protein [Planctomycetota bacterium]|nr:cupin domain-containing protein [Planctomycetota bacterium]